LLDILLPRAALLIFCEHFIVESISYVTTQLANLYALFICFILYTCWKCVQCVHIACIYYYCILHLRASYAVQSRYCVRSKTEKLL